VSDQIITNLVARVYALECALTTSEQWNVCACGHHGMSHDGRTNACLVCECPHFATRKKPNRYRTIDDEDIDAMMQLIAVWGVAFAGQDATPMANTPDAKEAADRIARLVNRR
jgi:hypothetical protein